MEEQCYEFLIEQSIKIIFILNEKFWKWMTSKNVYLTYDYDKSEKWRIQYEKNVLDSNQLFEEMIDDISNKFIHKNKIFFDEYLPIPFYVALGANKGLIIKPKKIFRKINVKKQWWRIGNRLILSKKKKVSKVPTLLILESKNAENEKYAYIIKSKKNKYERNSFNHLSLKKCLKKFIYEINKLLKTRKIESINLSIVASPSTSFAIGKILVKHNFIFNIYHYSVLENKNIIKAKIGPYTKIKLF